MTARKRNSQHSTSKDTRGRRRPTQISREQFDSTAENWRAANLPEQSNRETPQASNLQQNERNADSTNDEGSSINRNGRQGTSGSSPHPGSNREPGMIRGRTSEHQITDPFDLRPNRRREERQESTSNSALHNNSAYHADSISHTHPPTHCADRNGGHTEDLVEVSNDVSGLSETMTAVQSSERTDPTLTTLIDNSSDWSMLDVDQLEATYPFSNINFADYLEVFNGEDKAPTDDNNCPDQDPTAAQDDEQPERLDIQPQEGSPHFRRIELPLWGNNPQGEYVYVPGQPTPGRHQPLTRPIPIRDYVRAQEDTKNMSDAERRQHFQRQFPVETSVTVPPTGPDPNQQRTLSSADSSSVQREISENSTRFAEFTRLRGLSAPPPRSRDSRVEAHREQFRATPFPQRVLTPAEIAQRDRDRERRANTELPSDPPADPNELFRNFQVMRARQNSSLPNRRAADARRQEITNRQPTERAFNEPPTTPGPSNPSQVHQMRGRDPVQRPLPRQQAYSYLGPRRAGNKKDNEKGTE